jgi:hypothetical protein
VEWFDGGISRWYQGDGRGLDNSLIYLGIPRRLGLPLGPAAPSLERVYPEALPTVSLHTARAHGRHEKRPAKRAFPIPVIRRRSFSSLASKRRRRLRRGADRGLSLGQIAPSSLVTPCQVRSSGDKL